MAITVCILYMKETSNSVEVRLQKFCRFVLPILPTVCTQSIRTDRPKQTIQNAASDLRQDLHCLPLILELRHINKWLNGLV